MMSKFICLDPEGNYHCECTRGDNPCCMCTKPRIAVKVDDIKQMISLLNTDGINSKKEVSILLQKLLT